jgi:shikimate kinase
VYLIGYRGAGKTTVGRRLAEAMRVDFRDLDDAIEMRAGATIAEIFAAEGEPGFRARERRELELAAREGGRAVVATGGGIVLAEANVKLLRSSGFVVWLRAPPAVLRGRLERDSATAARRPALSGNSALDEVERMLAAREPLYASTAHVEVDTGSGGPDEAVRRILAEMEAAGAR